MSDPAPAIYLDTIPDELKRRGQWVVWRQEERDGKGTKILYNPRRPQAKARSTDPSTWSDLELALEVFRRPEHRFSGIGYVFSEMDEYCGIDLDGALDEEGSAEAWAEEIVEQIGSYTEVSPSGRGLHIIARATLPGGGTHKSHVGIFDRARYFTMTGEHWEASPLTIEDRQAEVEALYNIVTAPKEKLREERGPAEPVSLDDEALLEKARNAKNGHDFIDLWDGDEAGRTSASEADLALCSHLAFWTGRDEHRMDALFRQSGRMRKKWDERHSTTGLTYGQMTLQKALSGVGEVYTGGRTGHYVETEEWADVDPEAPAPTGTVPTLPEEALAVYQHARPGTALWLQEYVRFASQAAPMTPPSFHEAGALFAASTIIARRLFLPVSTQAIYPNLFLLFIAPSTLYSKTTGFRLLSDLFREAGLKHFLLPERMTPEAMVQELSLSVPATLHLADEETRAQWLKERAVAAKRGWALDEAHSLLDSLERDFNTGLLALILKLYDCPDDETVQTKGAWRTTVRRAYLSFFGATTPSSAAEHLTNSTNWTNGLWARFALIVPDEPPVFEFFPQRVEPPRAVVEGLQRLAGLFPTPSASLVEIEGEDDKKRKEVVVRGEGDPSAVVLADGVWEAWEAYSRATRYDLLMSGHLEPELFASYGRLGTQAMKVAMILAALDAHMLPVRVSLAHYARAQQIVEGWRVSLHLLRGNTLTTREESERDRVLAAVTQAGPDGLLIRDVYKPLKLGAKEARQHLDELQASGQVELFKTKAANGRRVEMVRRIAA